METGGEASWPASLIVGHDCTHHTFKESNDTATQPNVASVMRNSAILPYWRSGKREFLVDVQSFKCHFLNHYQSLCTCDRLNHGVQSGLSPLQN